MAERIELSGICVDISHDGRLMVAIGDNAVGLGIDDSYALVTFLRQHQVADRLSRAILRSHGLLEGI